MKPPDEPLRTLLQDWAHQEIQAQITPLTPALLRCKARLAREDARRVRLQRLRTLLLVPPVLLGGLMLASGLGHASALLQAFAAVQLASLGSLLTLFALVALAGPALTLD